MLYDEYFLLYKEGMGERLFDRMVYEDNNHPDLDTVITAAAVLDEMYIGSEGLKRWMLDKAQSESFIRSTGILAELDEQKLDQLINKKKQSLTTK